MSSRKKRILVVDDRPEFFERLRGQFSGRYEIIAARRPAMAVEFARWVGFDAVLCEIDLPRLSGWQLAERFSQHEHTRRIPFALMTSGDSVTPDDRPGAHWAELPILDKTSAARTIASAIELLLGQ